MSRSILFIEHSASVHGGQTSFLNLIEIAGRYFDRRAALYPHGGGLEAAVRSRFGDELEQHDCSEIAFTNRRKTLRDAWRLAWGCVTAFRYLPLVRRYDVVYVSSARWFAQMLVLSMFCRSSFVYHVRIDHSRFEKKLLARLARARRTRAVLVNTRFVYGRLLEQHPWMGASPRVQLFETPSFPPYNGMPFEDRFTPPPADASNARDAPLNVVLLGRISPEKGQDILRTLAPALPRCRFYLVGRAAEQDKAFLWQLLDETPDNVIYHGETDDVPGTLHALNAHVSLVPSRWDDPFPLVVAESVACSCLGVVRRRGGLTATAERVGLYSFDTDEAAVDALNTILALSPAERAAHARQQHAAVQREYAYEPFAAQFGACVASPSATEAKLSYDADVS